MTLHKNLIMTFLALFAVLGIAYAPVHAQEAQASQSSDARLVVIPTRAQNEISDDVDNAQRAINLANIRRQQAEGRINDLNGSIDELQLTGKATDRKLDQAKKAKNETEKISFEAEKNANKQAITMLNRLKDLRKTEAEVAQAEAKAATTEINALQLEGELATKRLEYDALQNGDATNLSLSTQQHVLREIETKLLKLQEEQADATKDLADRQKDMVSRRKSLHEAQMKLGTPSN